MYCIKDTYGTVKFAWSKKEALSWLDACSPNAKVWNFITGRVVARKVFGQMFN